MQQLPREPRELLPQLLIVTDWSDEDKFTSWVANLPGAIGEGDTQVDSIGSAVKAAQEQIQLYQAAGEQIPWAEPSFPTHNKFGFVRLPANVDFDHFRRVVEGEA